MSVINASLTAEQIERFHADGFLVLASFVDAATLETLRTAYEEILSGAVAAGGDRMLGGLTRQVIRPAEAHPVFASNAALDAGRRIGLQLIGRDVDLVFDMLIFKPPGDPHEVPWHQDAAYAEMPTAKAGSRIPLSALQFWVALDDADVENGCMHFLPGYHRQPLLEHMVAAGRPDKDDRLLALVDPGTQVDLDRAVAAPLPAGGCTIHSYGTPHYTPPNRSADRRRRAYIFNLAPWGVALSDERRRRLAGIEQPARPALARRSQAMTTLDGSVATPNGDSASQGG